NARLGEERVPARSAAHRPLADRQRAYAAHTEDARASLHEPRRCRKPHGAHGAERSRKPARVDRTLARLAEADQSDDPLRGADRSVAARSSPRARAALARGTRELLRADRQANILEAFGNEVHACRRITGPARAPLWSHEARTSVGGRKPIRRS